MGIHVRIRRGSYHDSVTLLQAQRALRELPGVEEAGLVMGTPANLQLLRQAGLDAPELREAGPDDLVAVVRARTEEDGLRALERLDELLARREGQPGQAYRPKSVRTAVGLLPGANLALVSVPGRFAAGVAEEALRQGLHVFLFSDNVPLAEEVRLKRLARERGLLVMGPDCGTALVGGVGLGFANAVRRGPVGIVAAAGTGLQEVACLVHRWGGGISHALGTGGRDVQEAVDASTASLALAALAQDAGTEVVVLVSKPPSPRVAAHLVALAEKCGKPVVVNFLGASPPRARGQVYFAATLEEAARLALRLSGTEVPPVVPPSGTAVRWAGEQRWLRGLFCGGTLCAEAQVVLRERLGRVWSNTPVSPEAALEDPLVSREHTALDLGADEFTWGRLHPMLDPSVRSQKMIQEAQDPEVAVLLVDVVLGYGAHPDPADEVARAWEEARGRARQGGRDLVCVASVCGTDEDPQGYPGQVHRLREAGVLVAPTNAAAAASAAAVLPPGARSGPASALPSLEVASERAELPPVPEPVRRLLSGPLRVVNVGLEQFAESLRSQGVPVVSVDWRPPASGDTEMLDLLARLGG
jgi:FdrA protein